MVLEQHQTMAATLVFPNSKVQPYLLVLVVLLVVLVVLGLALLLASG